MSDDRRCFSSTTAGTLTVRCEREFGHGGAHTATVDDMEIDPDFTYVVSWWPTEKSRAAVSPADTTEAG